MKKLMILLVVVIATGFTTCKSPDNSTNNEVLCTISFDQNQGVGGQTAQVKATYDKPMPTLTAQAPTLDGYHFTGYWDAQTGGKQYYDANLAPVSGQKWDKTEDATLYAHWSLTTVTTIISFVNTGGSGGQTATVTATLGQAMPAITEVPTPTTTGNIFTGYWDDQTNGKKYYNADKSSAANWDKETPAVTLYAQFAPEPVPSIVSLVQSETVTKTEDLTYTEIKAMVTNAINLAGGLNGIVKSGDNVVLKPNLVTTFQNWNVTGTPLPMLNNGVSTDWRVTQAVAEIVRDIVGPYNSATGKGKIIVMEGSAGGTMSSHFTNGGYTLTNLTAVNEIIGLDDASEGTYVTGGDNTSATTDYNTQITLTNYLYNNADHTRWNNTYPYYDQFYKNDGKYWVNKKMLEADVLISIPVLKNHYDAVVSGSIKNISIGAAPPKIYGGSASNMGRNGMVNHNSDNLHKWIADYFACLPADFVVMDGLQGLQDGPGAGNLTQLAAAQKNLRCILASKDPLAIDVVEANLVNWDYSIMNYFKYLAARGTVGGKPNGRTITLRGDPKDIVVLGNKKVDDIRTDFAGTMTAGTVGEKLTSAQKTKPTVSINSAAFSGTNLNLNLTLSTGANDAVVKIDVYVGGNYKKSFNTDTGMTNVSVDASGLAAGSHNIEVRAFTKYMYSDTKTTTATKS
jgi:uncharacterized protein (DUF362 family)